MENRITEERYIIRQQNKSYDRWTDDEVHAFLNIFAEDEMQRELETATRSVRRLKVYVKIAGKLRELNIFHTAKQCRAKLKKLKHDYKTVKDHNNRSGSNRRTGKWFDRLDAILGHRPFFSGTAAMKDSATSTTATTLLDPTEDTEPDNQSVEGQQRASWSPDEVVEFVRLWADRGVQEQLQSALRNEKVYIKLSSELASMGFSKAPNRCREKIKKLKQEYKKIKTMGGPNGREKRWFAIMDAVLSHKQGNGVLKVYNSATDSPVWIQPQRPSSFGLHLPGKCPSLSRAESQCVAPEMPGFGSGNSTAVGLESWQEPILVSDCREKTLSSWSSNEGPNIAGDQSATKPLHDDHCDSTVYSDKTRSIWLPDEVQVFLTLWADQSVQEQLLNTVRSTEVFTHLSCELASLGFNKTANQCRMKIKKLKQDYKKLKQRKGSKRCQRRWFTIIDRVLGYRPETDLASNEKDSATKHSPCLPQEVQCFAPNFNFSTMCLLIPPLRLMTAFMWHVTLQRSVMHYERVEELVRSLTDLIPELLTCNERVQLLLGLRARLVLELCRGKSTADPVLIQPHLDMIFTSTKDFKAEKDGVEMECLKSNFVEMVQTLMKDPSEKDYFFKELFPVHYGSRYDTALQTLVWDLISRLDKLLPIPDVTKTASWLSAAPSILDECGQMVFQPDQLKTVLEYHHQQGSLKCSSFSSHAGDTILSSLSCPPNSREKANLLITDLNALSRDNCVSNGSKQLLHGAEKDRPSDYNSEDDATAEGLSEENCVAEHSGEQNDKQLQECLYRTNITGSRCLRSAKVHGTCSLYPYSSNNTWLLQHIKKEPLQRDNSYLGPEEPHQSRTVQLIAGIKRIYSCTRCDKVFKKLSALKHHIGTHTLPFHCNQCEKRYSCKENLAKHQRVHTGERPFQCSFCGRGFTCSSILNMHVRTHTGERRYKCHICGKTSIQHLARHMLMHKGEKNYLCTECGKAFLSSGELRLHTRSHTGERPYTCKHCGKGFIAKCHLTVHMRSHTGERPYLCSQCTKGFPTANLLKRHMFVHNDRKPFQCSKCGKGFIQGHALKTHLKTHK